MPAYNRPELRATSVTIGTSAPRALAAFYARLLGGAVTRIEPPLPTDPETAGWAQVRTDTLTLNFEFESCWQEPVWPAQPGQPVATQHLDIHVTDLNLALDWALECGARLADTQPQADVRVMLDPAGHPFCLF